MNFLEIFLRFSRDLVVERLACGNTRYESFALSLVCPGSNPD